jgi:hypothetical protein
MPTVDGIDRGQNALLPPPRRNYYANEAAFTKVVVIGGKGEATPTCETQRPRVHIRNFLQECPKCDTPAATTQ